VSQQCPQVFPPGGSTEKLGEGKPKKMLKKCLTTFLRSGIGLENSNYIVFFVHNSTGKEVKILGGIEVVIFVSVLRHHETTKEIKEEEKR
jgi:hypothetical protein